MKIFLWTITLISGLCLLACRPTEPLDITLIPARETVITPPILPTWTPQSTISTTLSVPTNTATPLPTRTLIPTPTAETTLLTPIEMLAVGQTLPIDNDLLFISEGELHLWRPRTGQLHTLLTSTQANLGVTGWRPTADQQTVLIAQTQTSDNPGFTLSLFEANTEQLQELWSETDSYLLAYALAADGRSTAFITSTTSPGHDGGVESVQLIDNRSGQVSPLADCPNSRSLAHETNSFIYTVRCHSLAAAPDGQTWLWRDIVGVWQGGLGQSPRLLVPHDYFANDLPRIYSPTTDWSVDGRYQLLSAQRFEGSNLWVVDVTTGQTIELPNSVTGIDQVAYWQWTPDNYLFTVRPPITIVGETANLAELWHIQGNELVLAASLVLPDSEGIPPAAATQLGDGRFAFIINHTDSANAAARTLYLIAQFDQPAQPLVTLPPLRGHWSYTHGQSLAWTPDASGALYLLATPEITQPFYIPSAGSLLYDLSEQLGSHISHVLWLP